MLQSFSLIFDFLGICFGSCFLPLMLQAQMRDLKGFVETRQQLLTLKSNHRMNWIGFSVAHHLNSKYENWIGFSIFLFKNGTFRKRREFLITIPINAGKPFKLTYHLWELLKMEKKCLL